MNKNELAQKALEIIGECSSRKGKVRLYNSLLFVELNIDACIPKLNELYNTNVSREEVKNPITITIKDFLMYWDLDINLHVVPDEEEFKDNTTSSKVEQAQIHEINIENHESFAQNQEKTCIESEPTFKLNTLQKLGLFVFVIYAGVMFINQCTPINNEYTQQSEGLLSSFMKILNTLDSIFDPLSWLLGLSQLFLDSNTILNVICLVIFGGICIVATSFVLAGEKHNHYEFQPFIATIIVLLSIFKGYYGPPAFNLVWTILVPLTYIILVSLGSVIVNYLIILFHPKNRFIILILKIIPLLIWLFVFQLRHFIFKT